MDIDPPPGRTVFVASDQLASATRSRPTPDADSRRRLRARLQHAELILEIQKKPPRSWDHPEDLFLGSLELLIFACRESRTCMLFVVIEVT